jgi:hypothetical protein
MNKSHDSRVYRKPFRLQKLLVFCNYKGSLESLLVGTVSGIQGVTANDGLMGDG